MRRDYVNPKKKIRKHLTKRKTSYEKLYLVFIMAVLFIGVFTVVLQSNWQSEASSLVEYNGDQSEVIREEQDTIKVEEVVPTEKQVIVEGEENNGLFPKTKQEVYLEEMIKKEEINLTAQEEQYFANN